MGIVSVARDGEDEDGIVGVALGSFVQWAQTVDDDKAKPLMWMGRLEEWQRRRTGEEGTTLEMEKMNSSDGARWRFR